MGSSVNSFFGLVDKYAKFFLAVVVAYFGYRYIKGHKPDEDKKNEVAQSTHADHLQRPAALPKGSSLAKQKAYAEQMEVYSSALAADVFAQATDHTKFMWIWERSDKILKMLKTMADIKLPLSMVEAEYKLVEPNKNLLTELKERLTETEYRQAISKLKR